MKLDIADVDEDPEIDLKAIAEAPSLPGKLTADGESINTDDDYEHELKADQVPRFKGIRELAEKIGGISQVPLGTQKDDILVVDLDGTAYRIVDLFTGSINRLLVANTLFDRIVDQKLELQRLHDQVQVMLRELESKLTQA